MLNLAYNNNNNNIIIIIIIIIIIKVTGLFILKCCNHKAKEVIASIADKSLGWPTNNNGWHNEESCYL